MNPAVLSLLRDSGLAGADEVPAFEALGGGVSSEIWRVDLADGPVCVKRALPRLRVAQIWEAPVARNRYEYEWFRVAGDAAPGAVPGVLALGEDAFVMEYLEPRRYPLWKELLRQGRADAAFASEVGKCLGNIHAATTDVAALFPTDQIFHAIRLEPYLLATGRKHPALAERLQAIAHSVAHTKACLVHGDVSPKNLLVGPRGPIFLDAECAWYGDPAFDLAFCLNHLLLKCLWTPHAQGAFLACFDALAAGYLGQVDFNGLEQRAAALLPGLLLARVDGKSPVEYVTEEAQKDIVRRCAIALIEHPVSRLHEIRTAWRESLT
jgi:aminoglycoside phosphotransferase (APT) family kinase protein